MPPHDIVAWPTLLCGLLEGFTFLLREPIFRKAVLQIIPGFVSYGTTSVQPVRDHGATDPALGCELPDCIYKMFERKFSDSTEFVEFLRRKKYLCSNIATILLNGDLGCPSTYAGVTKPKMSNFVQCRE
jgi:hypothetical protein